MTAFLDAAEKGDLEDAVNGDPLTAMKMVEVVSQAPASDCPDGKCPTKK